MDLARWCWPLVLGAAGCGESLLGYDFPCKKDDDCGSGYLCSTSTSRCVRSNLSSGSGADGTDGTADRTDGTGGASGGPTLDLTEVTVSAYAKCVDAGECTEPDSGGQCNWGVAGREQYPVNCVNWDQSTDYCHWSGGRLPTESEWEFAATNGGATADPWGTGDATCSVAVMNDGGGDGCGASRTWEVCAKSAGNTRAGHCDLAGNLWEWTSTESGSDRVRRGGSYVEDASQVGAAARSVHAPSYMNSDHGIRCLRD
jgi:hypothetical protein